MTSRLVLALSTALFMAACGPSKSAESENQASDAEGVHCEEPSNPYDEGTGHYAGYDWAEKNGGSCEGKSESFNEGCEEYEQQEEEYSACEAKKK